MLVFAALSFVVSAVLVGVAVMLVFTDALPDVDSSMTATIVAVLLLLALFAAALGWLGLRLGRERLANPRRSYYPGF